MVHGYWVRVQTRGVLQIYESVQVRFEEVHVPTPFYRIPLISALKTVNWALSCTRLLY